MLEIRKEADGGLALIGRLDAVQAAKAQAALDAISGTVRLDFAQLEYISSAGLGVLLKTQKRLAAVGGGLRLVKLNAHILDVLRYSGFDQIFQIEA